MFRQFDCAALARQARLRATGQGDVADEVMVQRQHARMLLDQRGCLRGARVGMLLTLPGADRDQRVVGQHFADTDRVVMDVTPAERFETRPSLGAEPLTDRQDLRSRRAEGRPQVASRSPCAGYPA